MTSTSESVASPPEGEPPAPSARAEAVIHRLAASLGTVDDGSFFRSLVRELTSILDLDYALVGKLVAGGRGLTTLAACTPDGIVPSFSYPLAGTPCERVLAEGRVIFHREACETYPKDYLLEELGVEGYIGVPLLARGGKPLGLVSVMHREPIEEVELVIAVLQVFALRAAAELERKRADEALRASEQQLLHTQRLESIGTLAGGIAHDLNNVLAPVLMSVGLLHDLVVDDRGRRLLTSIERSTRRGMDLVRQVLWFARGVEGERRSFHPGRLLTEVGKIATESFPKNIEVSVEPWEDAPAIAGDPTQLYQVLMNLAVNARDAMPRGGVLRLGARAVDLAEERIPPQASASRPGPYVELTVADTGMGIPAEILERIFDPFYTTKDPGQGTGLGLSTALSIVRSHGGFLEVESSDVEGSEFRVLLPVGAEEAEAAPQAPAVTEASPVQGEGRVVLVVDDEPTIREVCCETLEAHGYRALTAADGAEAVAHFARYDGEVAAVLTDLAMPIMDGPSAIRSIRRLDRLVPILVMSGLADRHGLEEIEEHGVSAFLEKPFSAEELLSHLGEALAGEPLR